MDLASKETGNNFNLLRLFSAFLVLYGHGHMLHQVPLNTDLSHVLGLYIFFTISGFLIASSWSNDPNVVRYFVRRSWRIFPALIVVILLTVLVLGPLISTLSSDEYFNHPVTHQYLKNIFLRIYYELPGVFNENLYPNSVNGSLWTLPIEFSLYMSIVIIGVLIPNGRLSSALLFGVCLSLTLLGPTLSSDAIFIYGFELKELFVLGGFFGAGAVIYHWNISRYFSVTSFAIVLIVGVFMRQWPSFFAVFVYFMVPFLVICFGSMSSGRLDFFNRADYSYGLYIYAFPVQQTILHLFPELSMFWSISSTFFVTIVFAIFSWHCIEKPALAYKPKRKVKIKENDQAAQYSN